MSTFFETECGGETVTIEKTDDGDFIFHGYDENAELAAIELGFEPSACWIVWNAINEDELDTDLDGQVCEGNALAVKALLFAGASADSFDRDGGLSPLHTAAAYDRADVVKILLKAGASVSAKDHDKRTPLHEAAWWGYANIAKVLLEAGASVDAKTYAGWTPLHYAVAHGYPDVVKILLEAGASVDSKTNIGFTPLGLALRYDHIAAIEILEDWIAEHGK